MNIDTYDHDRESDDALHAELKTLRAHKARLDRELHEMRQINQKQMAFFQDAAAYCRWVMENDQGRYSVIAPTLMHDIAGIANDDPCFLPRVSGYAEAERKGVSELYK